MISIKKTDNVVYKEALFVGAWVLIFSALMEAVFLIIRKWSYTVLLGNLLSGGVGIINFLLLGFTVQKALETGDPKKAASMMKLSQIGRLLLMAGVAVLGATLPCFNLWATLIPLLFPRLSMIIRQIMLRKQVKEFKELTASFEAKDESEGLEGGNEQIE
ncbi:MAG: hypothetical protein J6B45_01720 [Clostridia bacterium]|nr:hypothetical protein [Clostridia bacterium]